MVSSMTDIHQPLRDALKAGPTGGVWHWDCDPVKHDPIGRTRYRVTTIGKTITQIYYSSYEGGPTNAAQDAAYIAAANPAAISALLAERDAAVKERDAALEFIDDLRQDLHSRRVADWYPEGAHNAAAAMSEDMRLLGNRCADFEVVGNAEPAQLPLLARSLSEWHEDDGTVVWWAWNGEQRGWAGEAAYIGSPLSDDWPGYHTHWTPHPQQPTIAALPQIKAGREQA
jgi:hypothetical protein